MPLQVIGAGLPRTGTASFAAALDQLGFGPVYHMSELMPRPHHYQLWMEAWDGKPVDWEALLQGFVATADAPACYFAGQLAQRYPDAQVVLTVRDPERWFASTQATVLSPEIAERANVSSVMQHASGAFGAMMHKIGWDPRDPETHDKARMIAHMTAHNEKIRASIAPGRLLVYEVSQGWEPLCSFLGVPVPATPFPNINSQDEFKKMIAETQADPTAIARSFSQQAQRQRGS